MEGFIYGKWLELYGGLRQKSWTALVVALTLSSEESPEYGAS